MNLNFMRNISLWLFEELVEENQKNHNYTAVDLDKHSTHNSAQFLSEDWTEKSDRVVGPKFGHMP